MIRVFYNYYKCYSISLLKVALQHRNKYTGLILIPWFSVSIITIFLSFILFLMLSPDGQDVHIFIFSMIDFIFLCPFYIVFYASCFVFSEDLNRTFTGKDADKSGKITTWAYKLAKIEDTRNRDGRVGS